MKIYNIILFFFVVNSSYSQIPFGMLNNSQTTKGYFTHTFQSQAEEPQPEGDTINFGNLDAGYFVDDINGNDSNTGTSPEQAWKTINKVNISSIPEGSKVVFIANGVWEETLTIPTSGSSGNPIIYDAYGTGVRPKIYGSKVVTGWTQHSGNIYYTTLTDDDIYQVFEDDEPLQSARYPNSGYFDVTSLSSQTQFASTEINGGTDYSGCTIVLRDSPWSLNTKTVTSSSGQTITINSATPYTIAVGEGFFMYGHLDFLTGAGQWYLDESANRLYVWTTDGTSPSNFTIRYSKETNNIVASSKNYITIKNLDLRHANDESILLTDCTYITIDSCNVEYATARGIRFEGYSSNNGTVTNSVIKGGVEFGIYSRGGNYTYTNNVISDIMTPTGIGVYGTGWGLWGNGINSDYGSNNIIRYNQLESIGNCGISFFDAPSTTIEYNYLHNIGVTKDDLGGIYCYESATGEDSDNSVIRYNIVENVIGIKDGTTYTFVQGIGIYLDERISEVTVQYNTVIGAGMSGTFLHENNVNCTIEYNTFFDCGNGHSVSKGSSGSGNSIQNNIFYNIETTKDREGGSNPTLGRMKPSDATAVTLDYNDYYDRHRASPFRRDESPWDYMNFTTWKSTFSVDANSTFEGTALEAGETEVIFYNTTTTAQDLNLSGFTYKNLSGDIVTEATLQPFTSIIFTKQ